MYSNTIISPSEVIKYAALNRFSECNVSDIYQIEMELVTECWGYAFHDIMKNNLADYSWAAQWTQGNYTEGNIVKNKGLFWRAKRDNSTEPLVENLDWEIAPKFYDNTDCGVFLNDLWCNFMARFISLKVAKQTASSNYLKLSSNGVVVSVGEGFIPADSKQMSFFLENLEAQAQKTWNNMMAWLKVVPTPSCLHEAKFMKNEGCATNKCDTKHHRYYVL